MNLDLEVIRQTIERGESLDAGTHSSPQPSLSLSRLQPRYLVRSSGGFRAVSVVVYESGDLHG